MDKLPNIMAEHVAGRLTDIYGGRVIAR